MTGSFIRERILWRAGKHRLLERRCVLYSDAPPEQVAAIDAALDENSGGVLLFWECEDRWTLLAETFVASRHHGAVQCCDLDGIGKQMSVPSLARDVESPNKREAEYLRIDATGQLIWAPAGSELFALMNLLGMFPLRAGAGASAAPGSE